MGSDCAPYAAPREPTHPIFDALAARYQSDRNEQFYAASANALLAAAATNSDRFPVPRQCLDLACGTGISTVAMTSAVPTAQWYGLDVAPEMLRIARAKPELGVTKFVHGQAERTPFPAQAFDWVVCCFAYHWLDPSVPIELRRILRPSGRLTMLVPLISPRGRESGNNWLARILLRYSRFIERRRSQGLTMDELGTELSEFRLLSATTVALDEEFAGPTELINVLESRGSLKAVFGEHADGIRRGVLVELDEPSNPLCFRWNLGVVDVCV